MKAERDAARAEVQVLREVNASIALMRESPQMANQLVVARAEVERLRGALEALVAGVEDSVLRFLEQYELQLRPDMDAVLRARVERARAALAKEGT